MPTEYEFGRYWLTKDVETLPARFDAALELARQMRPLVLSLGVSMIDVFHEEPLTAIKLADDAGLASIAGRHEMDPALVVEALHFFVSIGRELSAK